MKKLDLKEAKALNIDGSVYLENLAPAMANIIYQQTNDIKFVEPAQKLYKEGSAEFDEDDIEYFIRVITSPGCPTITLLKAALLGELNKLVTPKTK